MIRTPLLMVAVLLLGACTSESDAAEEQSWRTLSSARQISGEDHLSVQMEYVAGRLDVDAAPEGLLYRFEMRYDEEQFLPVAEYDESANALRIGIDSHGDGVSLEGIPDEARASLALAPGVPTELEIEFGAGRADLDLGGLSLRTADISTGASETRIGFAEPNRIVAERIKIEAGAADLRVTGLGNARTERIEFSGGVGATVLDFGGQWEHDTSVSAEMGIGALTLRLPREPAVRIARESVLTAFDAPGLIERDGGYYSSNWGSAAHRITIDLDAALGSIDVQWID